MSSVWKGIKEGLQNVSQDTQVVFGRLSKSKLWYGNWYHGERLIDTMEIPENLEFSRHHTVADFMEQGQWRINEVFRTAVPMVAKELEEIEISEEKDDTIHWVGSFNVTLTTKTAYEFYREKSQTVKWMKKLWQKFIPPKISVSVWKISWNRA